MRPRLPAAHGQTTTELAVLLGMLFMVAAGALVMLNPSIHGIFRRTTECVIGDVCQNGEETSSAHPPAPPAVPIPVADHEPLSACAELRDRARRLAGGLPNESNVIGRELALIDQSEMDGKQVSREFALDLLKQQIDEFLGQFATMRSIAIKTGSKKLTEILYTLTDTKDYLEAAKAGYAYGDDLVSGQSLRGLSARIRDDAVRLNTLLVDSGIADEVGGHLSELLGPAGALAYKTARLAIDFTYAFGQVYFDKKSAELAKQQMAGMLARYNAVLSKIADLQAELASRGCNPETQLPMGVANCQATPSTFWRTPDVPASYRRLLHCDSRVQDPDMRPHFDGCSVEVWQSVLGQTVGLVPIPSLCSGPGGVPIPCANRLFPDYTGDPNEPLAGIMFSDIEDRNFDREHPTRPCDRHDQCYQTPGRDRRDCDDEFYFSALQTCANSSAATNPRLFSECRRMAAAYTTALRAKGESAYEEDQVRNSLCCRVTK